MLQLIPYLFFIPALLVIGVVAFLIRAWMRMPKRGDAGYYSDDDSPGYQVPSLSDGNSDGDVDGE